MDKRYVRKDGRVVWTQSSGSLVWLQSGEPHYFICQVQDITDRVHAEQALRASEERFRSIAEGNPGMDMGNRRGWNLHVLQPGGRIHFGTRLVPPDRQELPRHRLPDHPSDMGGHIAPRNRREAGMARPAAAYAARIGGRRWLDSNALPLFDARGTVVGYRGVARDITDRRAATGADRPIEPDPGRAERHQLDHRPRPRPARTAARNLPHRRRRGRFQNGVDRRRGARRNEGHPLVWEGFEQGYLHEVGWRSPLWRRTRGPWARRCVTRKWWWSTTSKRTRNSCSSRKHWSAAFRSQMAMPLTVGDEVVAVLVLYATETGFFDYEELKLLKDLAGDISFALDYIGKEERLTYVSYYDTLTGLANRQLFFDRLAQSMHSRAPNGGSWRSSSSICKGSRESTTPWAATRGTKSSRNWRPAAAHHRRVRHSGTCRRRPLRRRPPQPSGVPDDAVDRRVDHRVLRQPLIVEDIELSTAVKIGIALYPADADTAETCSSTPKPR